MNTISLQGEVAIQRVGTLWVVVTPEVWNQDRSGKGRLAEATVSGSHLRMAAGSYGTWGLWIGMPMGRFLIARQHSGRRP